MAPEWTLVVSRRRPARAERTVPSPSAKAGGLAEEGGLDDEGAEGKVAGWWA